MMRRRDAQYRTRHNIYPQPTPISPTPRRCRHARKCGCYYARAQKTNVHTNVRVPTFPQELQAVKLLVAERAALEARLAEAEAVRSQDHLPPVTLAPLGSEVARASAKPPIQPRHGVGG